MSFAAVAIGGGALIGGGLAAYGASRQAKSANQAADANRQFDLQQTDWAKVMQAYEALGSDAPAWLKANLPKEQYDRVFGTPDFEQEVTRGPAPTAPGSGPRGFVGRSVSNATAALTPNASTSPQFRTVKGIPAMANIDALNAYYKDKRGTLAEIGDASAKGLEESDAIARRFGLATRRVEREGKLMEEEARRWGMGREAQIERDTARGLKAADDTSMADLISSGVGGGTILSNARAGNARNFAEVESNAKQLLSEEQIDRILGVKGGNRDVTAGRSAGEAALGRDLLGVNNQLMLAPTQARQQVFSSPTFNPFLGQNTSGYFPGLSSSGAAGVSAGNTISGVAGTAAGAYFSDPGQQRANAAGGTPTQNAWQGYRGI